MDSILEIIASYQFIKVGEINLCGERCKFELTKHIEGHGFVYLWVERSDEEVKIVYVGMAGKTVKARCNQHQAGFHGSTTGISHNTRLKDGLNAGKNYDVYARKAGIGSIVGENQISLVSVEEIAFIKKFRPTWNSQKFNL